jgi:hypothetical protein
MTWWKVVLIVLGSVVATVLGLYAYVVYIFGRISR